jgi:hypothetical protein
MYIIYNAENYSALKGLSHYYLGLGLGAIQIGKICH